MEHWQRQKCLCNISCNNDHNQTERKDFVPCVYRSPRSIIHTHGISFHCYASDTQMNQMTDTSVIIVTAEYVRLDA